MDFQLYQEMYPKSIKHGEGGSTWSCSILLFFEGSGRLGSYGKSKIQMDGELGEKRKKMGKLPYERVVFRASFAAKMIK